MSENFLDHIRAIEDPRVPGMVLYRLDDVLLSVLVGLLCRAEDFDEIEDVCTELLDWLGLFLPFERGIAPAQDPAADLGAARSAAAGASLRRSCPCSRLSVSCGDGQRPRSDRAADRARRRRRLARRAPWRMEGTCKHRLRHGAARDQEDRADLDRDTALPLIAAARSCPPRRRRARSLERREQSPLDTRRGVPRGPVPDPQGLLRPQPRYDPPRGPQPAPAPLKRKGLKAAISPAFRAAILAG